MTTPKTAPKMHRAIASTDGRAVCETKPLLVVPTVDPPEARRCDGSTFVH